METSNALTPNTVKKASASSSSSAGSSPLQSGKKLRQLRLPFAPINASRKRSKDNNQEDNHDNNQEDLLMTEKEPLAKVPRIDADADKGGKSDDDTECLEPEVVIIEERQGDHQSGGEKRDEDEHDGERGGKENDHIAREAVREDNSKEDKDRREVNGDDKKEMEVVKDGDDAVKTRADGEDEGSLHDQFHDEEVKVSTSKNVRKIRPQCITCPSATSPQSVVQQAKCDTEIIQTKCGDSEPMAVKRNEKDNPSATEKDDSLSCGKRRIQLQPVDVEANPARDGESNTTVTKKRVQLQRVATSQSPILKPAAETVEKAKRRRITPQCISSSTSSLKKVHKERKSSQVQSTTPSKLLLDTDAARTYAEDSPNKGEDGRDINSVKQHRDAEPLQATNDVVKVDDTSQLTTDQVSAVDEKPTSPLLMSPSSISTEVDNEQPKPHIVTEETPKSIQRETSFTTKTVSQSLSTTKGKVTPRQSAKKEELAARRMERERKREEAKLKKEEERKRKDDIKHKRLEVKRLKDQEKETKDRMRKEREEARLEEQQRKLEEQQRKLDEQQRKLAEQQERRRRVEARRSMTEREASAFSKFFIKKTTDTSGHDIMAPNNSLNSSSLEVDEGPFNQFRIKPQMRLASACRRVLNESEKSKLDDYVAISFPLIDFSRLYLRNELKRDGYQVGRSERTWPPSSATEEEVEVLSDEDISSANAVVDSDNSSIKNGGGSKKGICNRMRAKLLQFCENERPAFFGTFRKHSQSVSGRRPFSKDIVHVVNYDYDSDEDWVEEEQGESLSSDDDKDDDENDDDEIEEEDDGFFVDHGVLAKDELIRDDDDEDNSQNGSAGYDEELEARKQRLKAEQFEADYGKSKSVKKLKPRVLGCLWQNETSKDEGDVIVKEHLAKYLRSFAAVPFYPQPTNT